MAPRISKRLRDLRQAEARAEAEAKVIGYRVDILMNETQTYAEYTALKKPVEREFADSLVRYLKRQSSPGRLVEIPSQKVIEEWS